MKIHSVTLEYLDASGVKVVVSAEADDAADVVAFMRELSGRHGNTSAQGGYAEPGSNASGVSKPEELPPANTSGRSRRRGGQEAPDPTSPEPTPAAPAGRRSRRGATSETGDTSASNVSTSASASTETGRSRRRSRGGQEASDPTPAPSEPSQPSLANATTSPAAASSGRRRNRGGQEASSEITDADLTKAASQAAQRLGGPKKAIAVLKTFGVSNLAQLPQSERRRFLDTLQAAK